MSIGSSIASLLSCFMTPERKKASPAAHLPNGTILEIDPRLRAIASGIHSGASRSLSEVRKDLGDQIRACRNGLRGDPALTVMALPSLSGAGVVSLDMSKGQLPDSDPVLLLHLADAMLTDRVASLVEAVAHEPDPRQPPAGRTVIERLLAGPLKTQIATVEATFTISSRPRQERPGSTSGVIDLSVESDRGDAWRSTATLHALPLRRPGLIAHRVKEAMSLGAIYGGPPRNTDITPGLALIHDGQRRQLGPSLAAIGLLRDGASIKEAADGISAARRGARRPVAPRHRGPLPPAPPDPWAAAPVAGSQSGFMRVEPSPLIRCPAARQSAGLAPGRHGMRLEPSPVFRMPMT